MNRFERITGGAANKIANPLMWLMTLMLSVFIAGCGGGGSGGGSSILGPSGNSTPPQVTFVAPLTNATLVPVNTKLITAAFTAAMDPATLTPASFTLACPVGTPITGTVSYVATGNVATLTLPAATSLPANAVCTATVTTAAKNATGIALASNYVWQFTTGAAPDTTPPTVTGTIQTNGQTNVAINTKVGATFSKVMNPATITNANFTVKQTSTGAVVAGTVSYIGVSTTFIPAGNLAPSTSYTVTVKGGVGGVTDLAGNPMTNDFVITWSTGLASDITPPTVTGTINANGATNVAVNTKVGATFSKGMDPLTITNANFFLKETVSGNAVAGVVSYAGVSATFIPAGNLTPGTGYTVTVKGGVGGATDLAGNPMASNFVWSWTTGVSQNLTAPIVIGTIQANGQVGVATNTKVGATFNEGMDPLTITNLNFFVRETVSGNAVAGTVSLSGVNALFTPVNNLTPNTNYTVTVKGGVGGVLSLEGVPMASDFVISWTTSAAVDITPPTITATGPVNGASNVDINTSLTATFSKAMNPLSITNLNYTLKQTGGAAMTGTVSYAGLTATFIPLSSLAYSTNYTATIKGSGGGVSDLAGNEMVSDYILSWRTADIFQPAAAGQSGGVCVGAGCVNIGTASKYVILAKAGVSTVPNSVVTGNVGVSPAARGSLTGWSLIGEPTDTSYTSAQVTGRLFAADMVGGTTSVDLGTAVLDMGTAYTAAAGMATAGGGLTYAACPGVGAMSDVNDALAGGGSFPVTGIPAGVYTCAVDVTIPGTLTLNGTATDIWVFKITGKLTQSNGIHVNLTGGALAKNVFWQVSGVVSIGTTAQMQGVILAQTNIAVQTGATVIGRLLAQTAVTLDTATVTAP